MFIYWSNIFFAGMVALIILSIIIKKSTPSEEV